MKFEELLEHFADRPYFELREVLALADTGAKTVKNQLSNWVLGDKIIRLRRGKYLLNEPYRTSMPSSYYLSNCLLRPSYVSLHSALQFHGMIPEAVSVVHAVTPKHGNQWETDVGRFEYRSIKRDRFQGYEEYSTDGNRRSQTRFLMARPEKAPLDLFYLQPGEWTGARLRQMRFQNLEILDPETLARLVERFDSPKVSTASRRLNSMLAGEET